MFFTEIDLFMSLKSSSVTDAENDVLSQMHFMIQNIEKTALLSEHVNLLITEMKPETADQKMQDFKIQIDLTKREQQKLFSEKIVKSDFEMIIISDEKKKKNKKNKK
ncbi:uncharacterized protein BDCG_04274 [Blastomyces dermatitidis ER-3]|uniref:Uncharacterized protein n=2 Tax=Ajellomyces dermatitidis (strain ER-3 / ATCC MYA-2586) TaxID=559297 RepID=A0ABP2EY79_AJEDR|nr:uncharacterized protein BDCG_04274 [Blastomyces dermatitidis ER-3]EEQ89154.1 hypothetical protein BDCG_04274 [Blastomyces dermatitidis ER-3]